MGSTTTTTTTCLANLNYTDTAAALACLAEAVAQQQQDQQQENTSTAGRTTHHDDFSIGLDTFYLIFAASLMFVLQAGFAMVCAGCVRQKNVQNTMMKNVLDTCGSAIGFWVCGYGLAYGGAANNDQTTTTFAGNDNFFLMGESINYAYWFYQFAFAATTSTIVAGCLAERCQMMGYFLYSIMVAAIVFPLNAHAVWSVQGFLNAYNGDDAAGGPLFGVGVIDFGGSGVVHLSGGTIALVASIILKPRRGRFYDAQGNPLEHPVRIQGYSVPLQTLGTFLLWFGWYGFNGGSVQFISTADAAQIASLAVVNTTLGGAAGCIAALFADASWTYNQIGEFQLNLSMGLNGALTGLVAITGSCSVIEPWAACLSGAVGGLIYLGGSQALLWLRIDDAIDSIPVHMFGGVWGMIGTALFASPSKFKLVYGHDDHVGLFYALAQGTDANLLAANLVGLLYIAGFSAAIMTPFFVGLNKLGWFRADPIEELVGLDVNFTGAADANADEVVIDAIEGRTLLKENSRHRVDEIDDSGVDNEEQS